MMPQLMPQTEYKKQWYEKNVERLKIYGKNYYIQHRAKRLEQSRQAYQKNRELRLKQTQMYREQHPEDYKQYHNESYQAHKRETTVRHRAYYRDNLSRYLGYRRRYEIRLAKQREALFHLLGHVCTMCGEYDKVVLQFDHINGGGNADWRVFQHERGRFLKHYLGHPDEAKDKLQVLCCNCNRRKSVLAGEYLRRPEITPKGAVNVT